MLFPLILTIIYLNRHWRKIEEGAAQMELRRAILGTQPQGQGVAGLPGPFFPPPSLTELGPLQLFALQTDPPLKRAFWWHSFACFTNYWIVFIINLLGVKDPFKKLIKAINLFSSKCTYTSSVLHTMLESWLLGNVSAISLQFSFLFGAVLPFHSFPLPPQQG